MFVLGKNLTAKQRRLALIAMITVGWLSCSCVAGGQSTGTVLTALSLASLNFGNVAVGTASAAQTVDLYNYQLTPITISPITVAAPYAVSGGTCGTTLNGSSHCTISLTVTPSALGAVPAASLIVSTSAPNSPLTLALTAAGIAPTDLSKTSFKFGSVPVGTASATQTVYLYNYQLTPITISSITAPAAYSVSGGTCRSALAAHSSCTISLTVTPTAVGAVPAGNLVVSTNASNSPLTAALAATGTAGTTLSVSSSGSPSTYSSTVTFTASVPAGVTGTVTFYDGGVPIGTGAISGTTATFTTSSLIAGSHTISASWPGNGTVAAVTSGAITQVVNKATPAITWATFSSITYGTVLNGTQLNASSTVAGTFSYSPAAGTVLTAGSHSVTATFTPTDTTDYAIATATVTLTVNKATPAITWATPFSITYGTAIGGTQLNASSTVAGSFGYSPAAGTVLTAGSHSITATFTPTDTTDYAIATATVTLTVNKATPAITWATPFSIAYGTAIGGTQLNASSTIPGAFVYSPAAGTVLAPGSQTLSVTFTPTDTTDYTTATQTVALTVNGGTPTLSINATTVAFGSVMLNTLATQTVTLTSTGTASVTVSAATVTGAGFSLAGSTFSATLTPGQTATLSVQFDPTTASAATGQLTITSNSSSNGTAVIALTGTGAAASYSVDLGWDAPASSTDPVAGYNIYRSPGGSSTFLLLNSSLDTQTTYTDTTVQAGQAYDYIVESVDSSGVDSVPTSPIAVTIP